VTKLVAVTLQLPVPLQLPPLQPLKTDPDAAFADKVTVVEGGNSWEQTAPQLIPAGLDLTVPYPVPLLATETITVGAIGNCK
jgi:hypothetical protein